MTQNPSMKGFLSFLHHAAHLSPRFTHQNTLHKPLQINVIEFISLLETLDIQHEHEQNMNNYMCVSL